RRHWRCGRYWKDAEGQFARMHVRLEQRHEISEIGEKLVSKHQRVYGTLHQLDLWRLDHHFRGGLHLDLALLHLELEEIAAIGIAQGDRLTPIVQSQEQALFGADDLARWRRGCTGLAFGQLAAAPPA